MADTRAQLEAERWVISHGLKWLKGGPFSCQKVKLVWGGSFAFDIVSKDGAIVGSISTSSARTAGNNFATAKIQKIKCDTLYLTNVAYATRRLLVFTEKDMQLHFVKAAANGRFPEDVEIVHVALPADLQQRVELSRSLASAETSPQGNKVSTVENLSQLQMLEVNIDKFVDGDSKTTRIGYVNRNSQECGGHHSVSGNDHGQRAYRMKCLMKIGDKLCGHIYGANGTDVFQRKCPKCQGGAHGIPF